VCDDLAPVLGGSAAAMSLASDPPPPPLASTLGDPLARPFLRAPATTTLQKLAAAAIVPMVAVTLWLGFTSDHLEHPVAQALYRTYLSAAFVAVGVYWWRRRPASRFGPLLVIAGVLVWMVSWQASNAPLAFNIGVLAEAPTFVLAFYLFLAFPMGRVEPPAARWLMGALWLAVLGFFLPWALLSPVIAGGGPLNTCAPACPENVLQIASAPKLVDLAGKAEVYASLAITVAVLIVYAGRVRAASRPQRRALMAVAVTALPYLPIYFVATFAAWILYLEPSTLETLAWVTVVTRCLLPLGFLVALLQADRFAATALRALLERLAMRPTPEQWRGAVAAALDDDELRLGYHDPLTGSFREPDGASLEPPPAEARRAWVPVERDGKPVAAMVIDETLAEDPELVQAASIATVVAVENGSLEGELQATRARVLEAGEAERRRIERDIHDTAQQRLVALRIQLTLAGEQLAGASDRERLERLDVEVGRAIDELRNVAHGATPEVLGREGLAPALEAAVAQSAISVRIEAAGVGRHSEELETAVYFCCVECLQNAAKHAGRGASAIVHLSHDDGHLGFTVEDDGVGFDPHNVRRGAGLDNLADRVAALGGRLQISSRPGRGTRVTAQLPDR
jgi:signal transduction histidine kinase